MNLDHFTNTAIPVAQSAQIDNKDGANGAKMFLRILIGLLVFAVLSAGLITLIPIRIPLVLTSN
jgi:hypothetical protein